MIATHHPTAGVRIEENPLSHAELQVMDAWWRAANYLSVGQIYLLDNPLLKEPLKIEHIKPRLLGHWGTTPGLNFIYVAPQSRDQEARSERDLHRGPGARRSGPGCQYLAGGHLQRVLSEHLARRRRHEAPVHAILVSRRNSEPRRAGNSGVDSRRRRTGLFPGARLRRSLRQSGPARLLRDRRRRSRNRSAWPPVGIPTNSSIRRATAPCCRFSILNGYKIAGPTVLARIPQAELAQLLTGYGYHPYFVEGDDPAPDASAHGRHAGSRDREIRAIQTEARTHGFQERRTGP